MFQLNKELLDQLESTKEYKFVKSYTESFCKGMKVEDGNFVIGQREMTLLLTHVALNAFLEQKCDKDFENYLKDLLDKYREIFQVGDNFKADIKEYNDKLSISACNYNRWCSNEVDPEDDTKALDKVYHGWYESGYILGSPNNCKLF